MTTLYASILKLHALRDGTLELTQGHHAHAAFLAIVAQVDPALSARLHDANTRKPFTLSQLHGLPSSRNGVVRLRAGHECWLRVTLTGDEMFQAFIQHFMLGTTHPTIRLGAMEFAVSAVLTASESHPWAGYTTTQQLLNDAKATDMLTLEFASPFSFSLGDQRIEIMPRPELIFVGLQRKWQEWCQAPLMPLAAEWLREYVLVSQWELRSRMSRYGKQHQIGSEGRVTFRVFDTNAEQLHTLNLLADFAFYAGVGRKTTQGMGQARHVLSQHTES